MTIDPRKIQVLLEVLQRAPVSAAEQLICEELVAVLVQLAEPPAPPPSPPNPSPEP